MPRRRRVKVERPEHIVRRETWHGLHVGDRVEIAGPPQREATWRFHAHVVNTKNGTESVEVVGGGPGEHHVRSFLPSQVFPLGARRSGMPSLADAPQLPFE
ncbi:MAG: ubiquitin family protein [Acidimicrobiales bacterium]